MTGTQLEQFKGDKNMVMLGNRVKTVHNDENMKIIIFDCFLLGFLQSKKPQRSNISSRLSQLTPPPNMSRDSPGHSVHSVDSVPYYVTTPIFFSLFPFLDSIY